MRTILIGLVIALFASGISYRLAYERGQAEGLAEGLEADRLARMVEKTQDLAFPGMAGEIRDVLLIPDPIERVRVLAEIFSDLPPSHLDAVLHAYDTVIFQAGDPEVILVAQWWTRFDPEGAFRWTRRHWEARVPTVVSAVIREWARIDPEQAYEIVGPLNTGEHPLAPYVYALVVGWEESGKPGLDDLMIKMSGPHAQRATTATMRRRVRHLGAEGAIAWAEALPKESRNNAYQRLASALAEIDPQQATQFAERHMGSGEGRWLPRRVGTRWAKFDPQAAMIWLASLPPGEERDDGITESFRRWLKGNRSDAHAWVRSLAGREEDSAWAEPAFALYSLDIAVESPEEAVAFADANIRNSERRKPAVGNPLRYWLLQDETAALAWLAASDFDEKTKARIATIPDGLRTNYKLFLKQQHQKPQ
ncbi:MAG: hypothetical protein P8Q97_10155 [Myxococcota bacterium]|jgi:hypothetical protein|nr:hypothetical protein [Myxococcota bacterium]